MVRQEITRPLPRAVMVIVALVLASLMGPAVFSVTAEPARDEGQTANSDNSDDELPAFPGARGAGSTTPAGGGGEVYKVTSLEDYGDDEEPIPGTFRHAVEQEGPRLVVFGVGGAIRLKRPLIIENPRLTVAGNTAPFPGITVTAYPTMVRADDVVLRYLRFRLDVEVMRERFADEQDSGWDSINASRCENVVFDHISASHSVDETISFSGHVDDVTLSHSISAYSLRSTPLWTWRRMSPPLCRSFPPFGTFMRPNGTHFPSGGNGVRGWNRTRR